MRIVIGGEEDRFLNYLISTLIIGGLRQVKSKYLSTKIFSFSLIIIAIYLCHMTVFSMSPVPTVLSDDGNGGLKAIIGSAIKENNEVARGGIVNVTSTFGTREGSVLSNGGWQVDISGGVKGSEWPDGTNFTLTITLTDNDGSYYGETSGRVDGTVTNVGTIYLDPTAFSASASANPLSGPAPLTVDFNSNAIGGEKPYSWNWDFGDGNTSFNQNTTHIYDTEGAYIVTLRVSDSQGRNDSDSINIHVSSTANQPPTSPEITGKTILTTHQPYKFNIYASDINNDILTYKCSWDDGIYNTTNNVPSGTIIVYSHTWKNSGIYNITVTIMDQYNATSMNTISVYVDVILFIENQELQGYLIDENADGTYDIFHNNQTDIETITSVHEGIYKIDSDNDRTWEYTFDSLSGEILPLLSEHKTNSIIGLFLVFGIILILIIIILIFILKK